MRHIQQAGAGTLSRLLMVLAFTALALVACAQTTGEKVKLASVAGVSVGMTLDKAREALSRIGTAGAKSDEVQRGSGKEAWSLGTTDFATVAYKLTDGGTIKWVTGWLRPGKEIPFDEIADKASAARFQPTMAIWNVESADGSYRIVARGTDGKAAVVSLMAIVGKKYDDKGG